MLREALEELLVALHGEVALEEALVREAAVVEAGRRGVGEGEGDVREPRDAVDVAAWAATAASISTAAAFMTAS